MANVVEAKVLDADRLAGPLQITIVYPGDLRGLSASC